MDAITLLKNDHKTVNDLFKKFERSGERAHAEQRRLVDKIVEELSVHTSIEEEVFYPMVRSDVADVEDMVLEALEEHHIVKWTLAELVDMDPEADRFRAKVTVLIESVRHHVGEEEQDLFPKVRAALGRKRLGEIGDLLQAARNHAPKRPHPRLPDEPPANVASGVVGAVEQVAASIGDAAKDALDFVNPLSGREGSSPVDVTKELVADKTSRAAANVEREAATVKTRARKTANQGAKDNARRSRPRSKR